MLLAFEQIINQYVQNFNFQLTQMDHQTSNSSYYSFDALNAYDAYKSMKLKFKN